MQLNAKIIDKNSKKVIEKQLNEEFCNIVITNELVDVISELDQPYKIKLYSSDQNILKFLVKCKTSCFPTDISTKNVDLLKYIFSRFDFEFIYKAKNTNTKHNCLKNNNKVSNNNEFSLPFDLQRPPHEVKFVENGDIVLWQDLNTEEILIRRIVKQHMQNFPKYTTGKSKRIEYERKLIPELKQFEISANSDLAQHSLGRSIFSTINVDNKQYKIIKILREILN